LRSWRSSPGSSSPSKERTTIDLVFTIRKAAQQFAQRHQHGLAYGSPASQAEDNVSYKQLRADNFLPTNLLTPWEPWPTAADNDIQVSPNNSAVPKICAGYACVEIQISLAPGSSCAAIGPDLINGITAQAVTVTCNGTVLDAVMR
jgi:hypothetical protein